MKNSPGPAAYNPAGETKYKNSPAFTMSGMKGDLVMGHTKGMPGPGAYDQVERPKTTGFTFGNEQRKGLGSQRDEPGPGQYQVPDKMGTEAKNVLIAGRHEMKQDINQVGPGQYQLPSTLQGPKFSMGSGEKGTKLNKDSVLNPPPGSYNYDASPIKQKSPGVAFGTDKRDKQKPDNLPGPGNYSVPNTIDHRGATMKGKYKDNTKERAPGPGAYDSKMDPSKVRGGGIVFGNDAKSKGLKNSDSPGPGMYKVDSPYKGGHTFGKDIRDKQKPSGEPGPGQYNWRRQEGLTYF